jgi:hypothetical protein
MQTGSSETGKLKKLLMSLYGTEWRERVAMDSGSQVTFKMQNLLYRYMAIIENSCIADFSLTSFTKITLADLFFTV